MKYIFVSSVILGLETLKELVDMNLKPVAVLTQKKNILKKKSGGVDFKQFCNKKKIICKEIKNINDESTVQYLEKKSIDWLFIIGWSQLASSKILKLPKYGSIGIHPTLLPTGRGRAPIPWSIIKKLKYTGVTLFLLKKNADAGNIIDQLKIKITKNETATSLYKKIVILHKKIIRKNITKIKNNNFKEKKQHISKGSYWQKRNPEDGEIFQSFTTEKAYRYIRALTHPYPGAFIRLGSNKLIIWNAAISNNRPKRDYIKMKDGYVILKEISIC